MEKPKMPYIFMWPELTLDDVVYALIQAKSDDFNYYYDFLGHILESDTVTLEDAYLEVYGMTREEYRKNLEKQYKKYEENLHRQFEINRQEAALRKEKIYASARNIVPEDKMDIYRQAYELLVVMNPIADDKQEDFLKLLEYLNRDDFSLDTASEMFKQFSRRHTIVNIIECFDLLKCIRHLAKHGEELYGLLYSEEKEREVKETLERIRGHVSSIVELKPMKEPRKPTYEQKLNSFDRRMTSWAQVIHLCRKNQEKQPEGPKFN